MGKIGQQHGHRLDDDFVLTNTMIYWLTRTAVWASNAWMRIRGRAYRGYVHTPADLYRAAREAGFSVATLRGPAWTVAEATRS